MIVTPTRRHDAEVLDNRAVDDALRLRSLADIRRSNRVFGGTRAAVRATLAAIPHTLRHGTLLDVGTGLGDVPQAIQHAASARGITLHTIGVDEIDVLAGTARERLTSATCANAAALPFADRSIDIVLCSQLLHHFHGEHATRIVRELNRVARHRVIVCDLRRSWIAAGGFWAASFPLGFHPITRHDGVLSVLRGFTTQDLQEMIVDAIGVTPQLRRYLGFRLCASWTPQ